MPCADTLKDIFNFDILSTNPRAAFDNFVNDHCTVNMDFRVPSKFVNPNVFLLDGVKASTCFHSGYYLLETFFSQVVSEPNAEKFDNYVQNYCDSYSEQLAERYLFV